MNPLAQIRLNQFHEESRLLVIEEFKMLSSRNGETCKKCGFKQGSPFKGFPIYYCEHLIEAVSRNLNKKNKKVIRFLLESIDIIRKKNKDGEPQA